MAEDTTKSISDYFPMQKVRNLPMKTFGKLIRSEYQLVTRCFWHMCAKIKRLRVPNRVPTLINTVY